MTYETVDVRKLEGCGAEVLGIDRILAPPHLTTSRVGVTAAVYRLDQGILSVLDLTALFEFTRGDHHARFTARRSNDRGTTI